MIARKKLGRLLLLVLMLAASNWAFANPFTKDSNDIIKGAERRLGEIKSFISMGTDWVFVKGSEDQFLMTKNGRFAITVEKGELALNDIWQMKAIDFDDLDSASETYPLEALRMLPGMEQEPPIWFEFGNGPVIGTMFGIPGNEHVNTRMAQINWDKADFSIRYYVVPHLDPKDWVRYVCAPKSVQRALALGEVLKLEEPRKGACDTRKALEFAPRISAMMKLMKVSGVPFVVRHTDWKGNMLRGDFKAFLNGSNKEFLSAKD